MSFKNQLKLFPYDKLSHYQWASWFAASASVVSLPITMIAMQQSFVISALVASAASVVVAALAGKIGEHSDQRANDATLLENITRAEQGLAPLPMPHEVSESDFWASAVGCLPSAVPMLVFAIIAHNFSK